MKPDDKQSKKVSALNYNKKSTNDFPACLSFTITNRCNLHCQMCGQWSREGYMHNRKSTLKNEMKLGDWEKLVDEAASHNIKYILLRGGEPFLFPGIIELLEHINSKGIFVSIDTNATMVKKFAQDIARIGNIHLTISVDGTEKIHDEVRAVKGCYKMIKESVKALFESEEKYCKKIGKSVNFTISPYSVSALGAMPDMARDLKINTIAIVPYYFFSNETGKKYEKELREELGCKAYSWQGFHHEDSGINIDLFKKEYRKYLSNLKEVYNYPYMTLTEAEYEKWFTDPLAIIIQSNCNNVERLMDIQPDGEANFCVDFPDYSMGNVKNSTIKEVWNSEKAEEFRKFRRKKLLAVCYKCGAKYMSELRE